VLEYKLSDTLLYCTIRVILTSFTCIPSRVALHHHQPPTATNPHISIPKYFGLGALFIDVNTTVPPAPSDLVLNSYAASAAASPDTGPGTSTKNPQVDRRSLQYQRRFSGTETRTQDPKIPKSGPSSWLLDQSIHPINQFRAGPAESSISHILTSCDY
jgi:hypothetical protein